MRLLFSLLFLAGFATACHLGRSVTRFKANITDHKIFPATPVAPGEESFYFTPTSNRDIPLRINGKRYALDSFLRNETTTTALLLIHQDSLLFERYYRGYAPSDVSNIFSVSKSVTALLVGIALEDGYLGSVQDPITAYLPELKDGHPYFRELTLEHLLNMRSGLDFSEGYSSPFSSVAKLYYGRHQLRQIKKMDFEARPGTRRNYQSVSTTLLGMAVEEAPGKALGQYLEEKIWQPLGMENAASWSVDDKKHRATKAFCCLNLTARDLAKIGKLYLQGGQWDGRQIVSRDWIRRCTQPNMDNDCYQYQWYSVEGIGRAEGEELLYPDSLAAVQGAREQGYRHFYVDQKSSDKPDWHIRYCGPDYYAEGILGQFLYVHPERNIIAVRLGEKGDFDYEQLFQVLAERFGTKKE